MEELYTLLFWLVLCLEVNCSLDSRSFGVSFIVHSVHTGLGIFIIIAHGPGAKALGFIREIYLTYSSL